MTKTNMKKYATTAGIVVLTMAIVNRVTAAKPIKKLVYGG